MWLDNITRTLQSASAFLQTGKAPPGTPEYLKRKMEETNHLSSKKFFIIFTSVLMLGILYYSSVTILLTITLPEHVAAFVTIFSKTIEIFAIIIASYLGVQAAVDLRYNSSSDASIEGNVEAIKEEVIENLTQNTKDEDYTLK